MLELFISKFKIADREKMIVKASNGEEIIIDAEDFARVSQICWRVERYRGRRPIVCADIKLNGKFKKISLSKFLLNPTNGERVQRFRGAGDLDYRKENLFLGVAGAIKRKSGKPSGEHTSKYKGVYRMGEFWRATLQLEGKTLSLGLFKNEAEAARTYDAAVAAHFGDAAFKNFPEGS